MIRSWLDETYPDMPVQERQRRATAMDISLIEAQKEESMKTIYELNSVIRMSFIEAQFIKKVSIVYCVVYSLAVDCYQSVCSTTSRYRHSQLSVFIPVFLLMFQ